MHTLLAQSRMLAASISWSPGRNEAGTIVTMCWLALQNENTLHHYFYRALLTRVDESSYTQPALPS